MRAAAWQKETIFCTKILTSSSESFLQHAKSFLACRSWLLSAGVEYISQIISLSVNLSVSSAINQPDQWNTQPSIIACIQIFWENIVTCHTQSVTAWQPIFLQRSFACSAERSQFDSKPWRLVFHCLSSWLSLNTTGSKVNSSAHAACVVRGLFWMKCLFYVFIERKLFFVVHCNLSIMYQWLPNKLILYLTILEDVH